MQQLNLLLNTYTDLLPSKPYCSDDLEHGLVIRSKSTAILKRYIQHNHPYYSYFLVFDVDSQTSYIDLFYDGAGIPTPNLVIENPNNGNSHFLYQLKTPIYRTDASNIKPIEYANAIYNALRDVLKADPSYGQLISKNALHDSWRTHALRIEPYTLKQLARNLELTAKTISKSVSADEATGLGRNCYVFHTVRKWAYVEVRKYRGKTYNQWLDAVIKHCQQVNTSFPEPMQYNEVRGIAKSISRYCWKRDGHCYQEFIDRQSRKGAIGGKIGGAVRSAQFEHLRIKARELHAQGVSKSEIAHQLSVARSSVIRWLRN